MGVTVESWGTVAAETFGDGDRDIGTVTIGRAWGKILEDVLEKMESLLEIGVSHLRFYSKK